MRDELFGSLLVGLLGLGWQGCGESGSRQFLDGLETTGTVFSPISAKEGVHPDRSVLDDAGNPFVLASIGQEDRWYIQSNGGDILAFYSWATLLARGPSGENQYFSAMKLKDIYEKGAVKLELLSQVQETGIAAFQAVLDEFPNSVSYYVDPGTKEVIPFRLAPLAYDGIVALGGKPKHGWIKVQGPDENGDGQPESTVIQAGMDQ